jgi:hypothetical protein
MEKKQFIKVPAIQIKTKKHDIYFNEYINIKRD